MSPRDEDRARHGTGAGTGARANELANSQIFKKINIFKQSENNTNKLCKTWNI